MRIMMLALLAVVLLGGGGAGAYFYFSKSAEASVGPAGEIEDNAEAKSGEKREPLAESKYVSMDPLMLPIIDENGINQVVSLVMTLAVATDEDAAKVEQMTPRLKDAYIQNMYGVLNKHVAMKDGVIQIGMIKERLNEVSTKVMGEGVVQDVLLQVVQQRPI